MVPASAEGTTTIIRSGDPDRTIIVKKKPMKKVVIHKSAKPRKIIVIRADGTRVVRYVFPRRTSQVAVIHRD